MIYVFWDGYVLRSPNGSRYSLYSYWRHGRVRLVYNWLGSERDASDPSALLASKHLAPLA